MLEVAGLVDLIRNVFTFTVDGNFYTVCVPTVDVLEAYEKVGITVPLVVRLEGTNVDKAREMLDNCGRDIITAADLTDAAQKVIASLTA